MTTPTTPSADIRDPPSDRRTERGHVESQFSQTVSALGCPGHNVLTPARGAGPLDTGASLVAAVWCCLRSNVGGMVFRLHTGAMRLATVVALSGLLIGCVNSIESDITDRNAAIYRSVIADVVERSGVELDSSEGLPVLFIEAFDVDGIALEVQVELVTSFTEQYEIRFIDDRDEATAIDPVVDSLLIGLGPIVLDGTADVRGELYLSSDDVSAYRYTLAGRDDRWTIVGAPEEIEPEGFVAVS